MAGGSQQPWSPGRLGPIVGRLGCLLMVVVNVLIVSGIVILAHAMTVLREDPISARPEIGLGLSLLLSGFAMDVFGIATLGFGHVLTALDFRGRLPATHPRRPAVFFLGLLCGLLAFAWAGLTLVWRGFFLVPGSDLVEELINRLNDQNFNVAQYASRLGASPDSAGVWVMVGAAVVLLIAAGLHAAFFAQLKRTVRVKRPFHLVHWPGLAVVNLISNLLLAAAVLTGGGSGVLALGTIAGGGLKLLLVPALSITVYLSVFRNFQDLSTAQRPGPAVSGTVAATPRGARIQAPPPAPVAAVLPATPFTPTRLPHVADFEIPPPADPIGVTATPPAADAAPSPLRVFATPEPAPAAPPVHTAAATPPAGDFTPSTKPLDQLTMEEVSLEIRRHKDAIQATEDLFIAGEIDRTIYENIKAQRRDWILDLQDRYEGLRFDQFTSMDAATAPTTEPGNPGPPKEEDGAPAGSSQTREEGKGDKTPDRPRPKPDPETTK